MNTTTEAWMKDAVASLRGFGIAKIEGSYHGSGDEGWIDELTALDANGDDLTNGYPGEQFGGTTGYGLEDFVHALIDAGGAGGWENNEGGGGSFTIDLVTGKAEFDHFTTVEVNEPSPFSLTIGEPIVPDELGPTDPIKTVEERALDKLDDALADADADLREAIETLRRRLS